MCIESCVAVAMVGGGNNCCDRGMEEEEEKQQRRTVGEGGTEAPNAAELR